MGSTVAVSAVQPVPGVPEAGTIRLTGAITYREAPRLRRELLRMLERSGAPKMVLSMSGVEEMDTAGAAVLAEVIKRALEKNQRVLLCSPSDAVSKVFRLAGFSEVLARTCTDPAETHRRLLT
ncbi:MAG: STAS domain-containing protein [Acidobacteriota bacterium]